MNRRSVVSEKVVGAPQGSGPRPQSEDSRRGGHGARQPRSSRPPSQANRPTESRTSRSLRAVFLLLGQFVRMSNIAPVYRLFDQLRPTLHVEQPQEQTRYQRSYWTRRTQRSLVKDNLHQVRYIRPAPPKVTMSGLLSHQQ